MVPAINQKFYQFQMIYIAKREKNTYAAQQQLVPLLQLTKGLDNHYV